MGGSDWLQPCLVRKRYAASDLGYANIRILKYEGRSSGMISPLRNQLVIRWPIMGRGGWQECWQGYFLQVGSMLKR
jgi:hypothetical protein